MITGEKVKAISIIIHSILKSQLRNGIIEQENNIFLIPEDKYKNINMELRELIKSFEDINLTKDILYIVKGDISRSRIVYYYSVGMKQVEEYYKLKEHFSVQLLSILLLMNLIEENNITNVNISKSPSELFNYYLEEMIPSKEIKKISILADQIYNKISKANFAKMMKIKR